MSSNESSELDDLDWSGGWTALHDAVLCSDLVEVEKLLAAGADVNAKTTRSDRADADVVLCRWSTPLHAAAAAAAVGCDDLKIVQTLLAHGADLEARDFLRSARRTQLGKRSRRAAFFLFLFRLLARRRCSSLQRTDTGALSSISSSLVPTCTTALLGELIERVLRGLATKTKKK